MGTTNEIKKIHHIYWNVVTLHINWNIVTLPKIYGKLGISKVNGKNSAIISSLKWRFIKNKMHFWVKILQSKYKNKCDSNLISQKVTDSYIWKRLRKNQKIYLQGISWIVSHRSKINF